MDPECGAGDRGIGCSATGTSAGAMRTADGKVVPWLLYAKINYSVGPVSKSWADVLNSKDSWKLQWHIGMLDR